MSDGENRDFVAARASPEWFSCFQTFFFKVNRQAGRMCVMDLATTTVTATPMSGTASTDEDGTVRVLSTDGTVTVAPEATMATAYPITPTTPLVTGVVVGPSGQGEPGRREAFGSGVDARTGSRGGGGGDVEGMLAGEVLRVIVSAFECIGFGCLFCVFDEALC